MPEYESKRRTRMSQEDLMREYRGDSVKKRKKKVSALPPLQKRKEAKIIHEARTAMPPVSPVRRQQNEQRRALEEKRIREEKRNRKLKKKSNRKKKKRNMLLYDILFIVLIVGTLSILSVTVIFNIGEIEIIGNEKYTDEQVIAASGVKAGDNLVRLDTNAAKEGILSKLVYVDDAEVSRSFPNKLRITLTTAIPMAEIYSGGKYYVVSYNNKLLDIAETQHHTKTAVKGIILSDANEIGKSIVVDEEGKLDIVEAILAEMEKQELTGDLEIDIFDSMSIKMVYDNRLQIEFGASSQIYEKMYALGILVKEEIGKDERLSIRLSDPERVVTKPIYVQEEAVSTTPEETTAPENTDATEAVPETTTTAA